MKTSIALGRSSWLLLLLRQLSFTQGQANVCFIVYQMADNDLEYFIREDNHELIQSPAIKKPSLTTWVYHDGRNFKDGFFNDLFHNIRDPLEDVYYRNGTVLSNGNFKGSVYLTWDHASGKMVLDQALTGEQNGDASQTIVDFVTHALTDCVENRNTTEYLVLLSSHGAGWGGFGGDDYPGATTTSNRNRQLQYRRRLIQPNNEIVTALSTALEMVPGAPNKYNVIAFDSCLMSALDALDEYHALADYYLASEATEPGHGFAYNYLENVDSALAMARDMHRDYLEQKQGKVHQTPKTLAIIDTAKFMTFLTAWEAFTAELTPLLTVDPYLLPILNRARQISVSFQGYSDEGKQQTAVDIGSFLSTFDALCQPVEGGSLQQLRSTAVEAYTVMQVESGVGPGTPEGATGVQVFWPTRRDFAEYEDFYTQVLFDDPAFATQDAPNWLAFLKAFYAASETTSATGDSVCVANLASITQPTREGQLLLNPSSKEVGKGIMVQSEVTRNTEEVVVEFGMDLTPALELRRAAAGRQRVLTRGQVASSSSSRHPVMARFLKRRQNRRGRRRRVQDDAAAEDDDDFLVLFGGDVSGTYSDSLYQATWKGNFFLIFDDGGQSEPAYAADLGDGARALPVMYFPSNITVSGTDFPHRTTEEDAKELGGVYGYLSVVVTSEDEQLLTSDATTLYTETRDSFQETPRTAGGRIVPIIYAEASIDGGSFSVYVGGFNGTVFDWGNADNEVSVRTLHWQTALAENEALGLKHVIVDIAAYDFHTTTTEGASPNETLKGFDYELFVYPDEEESGASAAWNWSMTSLVAAMLLLAFPLL